MTAASDVYSFGIVLLELLTGRRAIDKTKPHREQNLADWARPQLKDPRKLRRILDPRLEGMYSESGAQKAALLAYECLSHRAKSRPTMSTVVKTLEPLKDYKDVSSVMFVYTAPTEKDTKTVSAEKDQGEEEQKELKKENEDHHQHHRNRRHHHHRHQLDHKHRTRSPNSTMVYSETALQQKLRSNDSRLHHGMKRA